MVLRCTTYNCNSIRNNREIVNNILDKSDVVFLQEIMLNKSDLDILNDFNSNFDNIAFVLDRDFEDINEGRPTAGVAIFWRRHLTSYISPLIIDESLIGIVINNGSEKVLIINVYLPCDFQTIAALDKYRNSLAELGNVLREQNINSVLLTGDFNADPFKGRFWRELLQFQQAFSLFVADLCLPLGSFTFLSPGKNTTSWLDHILCTKEVLRNISNISIDYECAIFDHFPLYFEFEFSLNVLPSTFLNDDLVRNLVHWSKINKTQQSEISQKIDMLIVNGNIMCYETLNCTVEGCSNSNHIRQLDQIFDDVIVMLLDSTKKFSHQSIKKAKIVPGWNANVKQLHSNARHHFLLWKGKGKPHEGIYLDNMKASRTAFKIALKKCKENEEQIRREKLLDNLKCKNFKAFWKEVNAIRNSNDSEINIVDGEKDSSVISQIFSDKYKKIFANQLSEPCPQETKECSSFKCIRFSKHDVLEGIKKLKPSVGMDGIHSNHLKFCPDSCVNLIAELYSSFSRHFHVPVNLLKGIITPTVKDRFGDLRNSDNYRPVMSSSAFYKLLEYCLLSHIEPHVTLNDRQHGFRSNYSTSTACLVLKETVLNYWKSNSKVHACFLDIRKAFDSVNYDILFKKLMQCGIPPMYANFIREMYLNQLVRVRFKSGLSEEWRVGNGVRQGGVLSGLLFSIYINSLIDKISGMKYGCRLGIQNCNIIVYADDIVLLAPTRYALQFLLDEALAECNKLNLSFNCMKSKYLVFNPRDKINTPVSHIEIENTPLERVTSFKYLGIILNSNLNNIDDITRARNKFYSDFNSLLRKFSFTSIPVKLLLFQHFCLQFYGSELWFYNDRALTSLKQFGVGYHKAIKKILNLSYHESNHFACQEASLPTFKHYLNKMRFTSAVRIFTNPCLFISKAMGYLSISSICLNEIKEIFMNIYDVELLLEQDRDAVLSRISYVQDHEDQMREALPLNTLI